MNKVINNLDEMDKFAIFIKHRVFNKYSDQKMATVLALHGELGAGKTAFVKSLAKALGVRDNITSPTFVIMKLFDTSNSKYKRLVHIDAYRIEDERELEVLGWREIISKPSNLIALEWPERVSSLIPSSAIRINFEFVGECTRRVSIRK